MMLQSITLKNKHEIPLRSLNLIIGPNNSGKSSLLADLQSLKDTGVLLGSHDPERLTEEQIQQYMDSKKNYEVPAPNGGRWKKESWEDAQVMIKSHFDYTSKALLVEKWKGSTTILDGKTRLSIVDDQPYRGIGSDQPRNIFETLRRDRSLKAKLQFYLGAVLPGKFFALWNPEQTKLRAYICDKEPINDIEYFDSPEAKKFFEENARPLSYYSDGIKAYLGILVNVIAGGKAHFLIDEPEAFLHPNLCFKLGQTLAQISREGENLCFCATHSPYFLKGCLSHKPAEVSVTRLEYESGESRAKTLETEDIMSVIHDPLLNNIGVTEGLFHSRVVVTEGDSDRAFYTEINNRLITFNQGGVRDCLFINAQNKQTIAKVMTLFRKVSIPCAAVSDIDTFKDGGTNFSNILSSLSVPSGTSDALLLLRERVDKSLKAAALEADLEEITYENLANELNKARDAEKDPREFLSSIRGKTKPPDYKRLGGLKLLSGTELKDAQNLAGQLDDAGWFILRDGEVEHWLLSLNVGVSKQGWLLRIFEAMGADPDDESYIKPTEDLGDVWAFINRIAEWFS